MIPIHDLHIYHHFRVDSLVLYYVAFWRPLAYLVLFLAMILEGEIFLFTAAFLAAQHFIDPAITFFVLFLGVQFGDSLWYWLGHKINHSDNAVSRWLVKVTGSFDEHIQKNTLRTIFISKFTIGFHHLILARAGVLKVKYREFFRDDFYANIAWIAIVGGLGYLSGASFGLFKHYLRFAEYALLISLGLYLVLNFLIAKFTLKKKL